LIVCLDEPTNYLDAESVELLQRAIRHFRGGCAVVTHSEKFVEEVCNEVWEVSCGKIKVLRSESNGAVEGHGPARGSQTAKK